MYIYIYKERERERFLDLIWTSGEAVQLIRSISHFGCTPQGLSVDHRRLYTQNLFSGGFIIIICHVLDVSCGPFGRPHIL